MYNFNKLMLKILIIYETFLLASLYTEASKDPCEDFYEYACSNYGLENPDIHYNEITEHIEYKVNEILLEYMKKQLERRESYYTHHPSVETYYDKMITYYEACVKDKDNKFGKYLDVIKPFISDFWSLLGQIQSYGVNNVIVNQSITRNEDNTLNVALSPVYNSSLPDIESVKEILENLKIYNVEENLAAIDLKWQQQVQHFPKNDAIQLSVKQLTQRYPRLNLQTYLKNLLAEEVNNIATITVYNDEYFMFLNNNLKPEDMSDSLMYLTIKYLYYLQQNEVVEREPEKCLKDLRNKFDLAVNYLYYHNFYKRREPVYQRILNDMVHHIVIIMKKYLNENYLQLPSKHIVELIKKLDAIRINIGNIPNNFYYNTIETYYQDIPHLTRTNYNANHLLLLKHLYRKSLLYKRNQTHEIRSQYTRSSPYYLLEKNMVVLPYAVFQRPLFHYKQTPLQIVSSFGFVLTHELTHAIDDRSLKSDYPHIPNHYNFTKSLSCMQQQKPTDSIHERIADLFALHVVYRYFLEYYAEDHKGDWRKEFFVNLAQFFCNKGNIIAIDHDADEVRLRQMLANFEPFAETFGCREGSPQNPKTKCRLY